MTTPDRDPLRARAPMYRMRIRAGSMVGRCRQPRGRRNLDTRFLCRVRTRMILVSDMPAGVAALVNRFCECACRAAEDQQQRDNATNAPRQDPMMRECVHDVLPS